jgi:epoxyqueuosine reductase
MQLQRATFGQSIGRLWGLNTRMPAAVRRRLSAEVTQKALSLGASLAGIAYGATLRTSPSHRGGKARWPPDARSAVVLALAHQPDDPLLDRWDNNPGHSPGNRALIRTSTALVRWLKQQHGIMARSMPYQVVQGGIFVKDAAVMAGLGTIGRNNLFITPDFGPCIRLRVVLTTARLVPSGPRADFHPCDTCPAPCLTVCPQAAFDSGTYDRSRCMRQMAADENAAAAGVRSGIQYCRACELACPVGK